MAEERRLVTVVFADVVGSTSLGENLDPEDMRALLGRFFALASEVVSAYGGTLEKFIGDAVFAVFGLPQAHGDDPQRAVAAALELRDRAQADDVLRERLPIRIGLNTGEVVATADRSRGDFLVVGDAVNVAARLQQAAEPWEILSTDRTARAAGTAFAFGPALDLSVRGKSVSVPARAVLGHASETPRRRLPIVGRDADLAQLDLVASRAFDELRPFLVSVTALPGIGKSRLVQEFVDRLASTEERRPRVLTAQCLPYGQRLTYWPLRGLLIDLLDLPEGATGDELLDALEGWLRQAGHAAHRDLARVIAATIGVGDAEVEDGSRLQAAWRELVELASLREPLVIVIEDLHWASDSLLDLVEHLLQPRGDLPLLVVALARPELLDRRRSWGGGRRNYVSLALEPLRPREVAQMVTHLLEREDPEIARVAAERADGNPLFVGEIVRALVERGTDGHGPELPDTVQGTVLARLDLLDPAPRRLLQVGSVFGRSFQRAGIVAVDPELAADLTRLVGELVERDLLESARGDTWTFRHILVREVAYGTLPRSARARLHRRAADWLAALAEGRESELAELVALHYREAAVLGRAVAAPDREVESTAVAWLIGAAETAAGAAATIEAAHHLRHAIELASDEQLPELYGRLGYAIGTGDRATEAYLTAVRHGREQGRDANFLLLYLARALQVYGRWFASVAQQPTREQLDSLRTEARALVPMATDERAKAIFHTAEGFLAYWVRNTGAAPEPGEIAAAEASARQALESAERLEDVRLISAALDALASVIQSTRVREAAALQARRLSLEPLDFNERGDAYFTLAWLLATFGDLEGTVRTASEGLEFAQSPQGAGFLGIAAWAAYALTLLGRWDEVPDWAAREHSQWIDNERPSAAYIIQGFYSALAVARARHDGQAAEKWRDSLDEILRAFSPPHPTAALSGLLQPDVERLVSDVLLQRHRFPTERFYHLEHVLGLVTDHGVTVPVEILEPMLTDAVRYETPVLEAQTRRALGLAKAEPDDLRRALAIFERLGATPAAARVRIELGNLTADDELVRGGRDVLEKLGDLEYLGRVGVG